MCVLLSKNCLFVTLVVLTFLSLHHVHQCLAFPNLHKLEVEYEDRDLWPFGIVPYKLSTGFSQGEIFNIYNAMGKIENNTCVRFERIDHEPFDKRHKAYINIAPSAHCFSNFGYSGKKQVIKLNSRLCMTEPQDILEYLGQAIGVNFVEFSSSSQVFYKDIKHLYCGQKLLKYYDYIQTVNHLKTKKEVLKHLGLDANNFRF